MYSTHCIEIVNGSVELVANNGIARESGRVSVEYWCNNDRFRLMNCAAFIRAAANNQASMTDVIYTIIRSYGANMFKSAWTWALDETPLTKFADDAMVAYEESDLIARSSLQAEYEAFRKQYPSHFSLCSNPDQFQWWVWNQGHQTEFNTLKLREYEARLA